MSDENRTDCDKENVRVTENDEQIENNGTVSYDDGVIGAGSFCDPLTDGTEPEENADIDTDGKDTGRTKKKKKTSYGKSGSLSVNKIIQISVALLLTLALLVAYPIYSWFRLQRQIARYEKISVPNSLYITAARREDSRYIEMDNIDITATWSKDSDGTYIADATYQDYVFTVAGDYVTSYTLQLAHTTNNNYKYEIFEADVTNVRPTGENVAIGKDYVEYTLSKSYDPSLLADIADPIYRDSPAGTTLFYSVKTDNSGTPKPISLNAVNYTVADADSLTASEYTINTETGTKTVKYSGHYLNWESDFAAFGSGNYYYETTYDETATVGTGANTNVQTHAVPLYWQATGIPVEGGTITRSPFFHEYILRVSWTNDQSETDPSAEYKDTDIVYISVKVG